MTVMTMIISVSMLIRITVFLRLQDIVFPLPKQSQKSRSVLKDRSRSLGLIRKAKTRIVAELQRCELVVCSYSRERKTLSYSRINSVERDFPKYLVIIKG